MKTLPWFLALLSLTALSACGGPGEVGDACESKEDCADDLECHIHEHDGEDEDHGECEEPDTDA